MERIVKIWKLTDSKSNKLILIRDQSIYIGNPNQEDLNKLSSTSTDFEFVNQLFSIPYSYIKSVENQVGNRELNIFYGRNSEEKIIAEREEIKNEIFDYLRLDLKNFNYSSQLPTVLNYAKAQFFAFFIVTAIFIWSLYLAVQIESETDFKNESLRTGIYGLVFIIANVGVTKIILGYTVLLAITLIALARRIKSRTVIQFLKRRK